MPGREHVCAKANLSSVFASTSEAIQGLEAQNAGLLRDARSDEDAFVTHDANLMSYARSILPVQPMGGEQALVYSFTLPGVHPHDIASILDQEGVAIRAGHLCAQPLMKLLGVPALARASFGVYNTREDIDALAKGIERVKQVFRC